MISIETPLTQQKLKGLKAGDQVLIQGTIYTSRDAGHKRLISLINENKPLPFDIKDQIIYYVGPTDTKPGHTFGSAGPTTSGRMDLYAPTLISLGLTGMIGKGLRNEKVKDAIKEYGSIYFGAIGGAGAIIGKTIVKSEIIAFEDLGTEALRKLTVKDFPAVVVIDSNGNDLYEIGKANYLKQLNQ